MGLFEARIGQLQRKRVELEETAYELQEAILPNPGLGAARESARLGRKIRRLQFVQRVIRTLSLGLVK